jgi:hypothetical protein
MTGSLDVAGDINSSESYKLDGDTFLSNTGEYNTWVGKDAGASMTTGSHNTAVGESTLRYNTTGYTNTAVGYATLLHNTEGFFNSAIGSQSLIENTTGSHNSAVGTGALLYNTTGSYNTAVGTSALRGNTTGQYNVAMGYGAGYYHVTGNNNTFIGYQAGRGSPVMSGSGNVFLGYRAGYAEYGSNKLYIANSEYNPPLIYGDFSTGNIGLGTTDPDNDKLDVRGRAYASGGWQTTNADYAEWFEKEGEAEVGDIIGINLETGKVRRYRAGDKFLGIYSPNPAFVGNRLGETDEEMAKTHLLVGLLGQMDFSEEQVVIEGRIVKTVDGEEVGILLNNGKVFIGR